MMMNTTDTSKRAVAETIATYLASDDELLQNFRYFDVSEVSLDASPQSFYCSWVMSIMGTAFYSRWNTIRQQVARHLELAAQPDWATVSALAHDMVTEE